MYSIEFSRDGKRFLPVPEHGDGGSRPVRRHSLTAIQLEADRARARWRTDHVRIVPPPANPAVEALRALVARINDLDALGLLEDLHDELLQAELALQQVRAD
jgi:hypothetical protein